MLSPPVTHIVKENRRGETLVIQSGGRRSIKEEDLKDNLGAHQLHISAYCGNDGEVIDMLDRNSACIDVRERSGREALHYAAFGGHASIVRTLLGYRATVTSEDSERLQPLYYAAAHGHCEVVQLLIECKSDVNHRSKGNVHMLHEACGTGQLATVSLLLDHRADVDPEDSHGVCPIDLATARRHSDVVAILKDARAVAALLAQAAAAQRHKNHVFAHELLAMAKGTLEKHDLRRRIAEVAWDMSRLELSLEEYGRCIRSCQELLQSGSSTVRKDEVRRCLQEARLGIARLRERGLAQKSLESQAAAGVGSAGVQEVKASDPEAGPDRVVESPGSVETECSGAGDASKESAEEVMSKEAECPVQTGPGVSSASSGSAAEDQLELAERDNGQEAMATCVVCLSSEAAFAGRRCGHLAWCAGCRRKAVHAALGEQGSRRSLTAAQLDRVAVVCPVCRQPSCVLRFRGRAWCRTLGADEVYVPLHGP